MPATSANPRHSASSATTKRPKSGSSCTAAMEPVASMRAMRAGVFSRGMRAVASAAAVSAGVGRHQRDCRRSVSPAALLPLACLHGHLCASKLTVLRWKLRTLYWFTKSVVREADAGASAKKATDASGTACAPSHIDIDLPWIFHRDIFLAATRSKKRSPSRGTAHFGLAVGRVKRSCISGWASYS